MRHGDRWVSRTSLARIPSSKRTFSLLRVQGHDGCSRAAQRAQASVAGARVYEEVRGAHLELASDGRAPSTAPPGPGACAREKGGEEQGVRGAERGRGGGRRRERLRGAPTCKFSRCARDRCGSRSTPRGQEYGA